MEFLDDWTRNQANPEGGKLSEGPSRDTSDIRHPIGLQSAPELACQSGLFGGLAHKLLIKRANLWGTSLADAQESVAKTCVRAA